MEMCEQFSSSGSSASSPRVIARRNEFRRVPRLEIVDDDVIEEKYEAIVSLWCVPYFSGRGQLEQTRRHDVGEVVVRTTTRISKRRKQVLKWGIGAIQSTIFNKSNSISITRPAVDGGV